MNAKDKGTRAEYRGHKKPPTKQPRLPSAISGSRRQRSSHSQPQPGGRPVLDERVPTLVLDVISSIGAAIASASMRVPYSEARQAMASNEDEKCELTRAVVEVAEKHYAFFKQNKAVIELGVVWAAVHVRHFDNFFARVDGAVEEPVCSPRDALFFAAVALAPLLIFAFVSIVQHSRRA
jgi:hypothetical protein